MNIYLIMQRTLQKRLFKTTKPINFLKMCRLQLIDTPFHREFLNLPRQCSKKLLLIQFENISYVTEV